MSVRILLVDDQRDDRKTIADLLSREEALSKYALRILEAGDGAEALEILRREPPDLIITDLLMPRTDGFELCRLIRDQPEGKNLPLLVISGVYKDANVAKQLKESFGAELLAKPLQFRTLVGRVLELLSRASQSTDKAHSWTQPSAFHGAVAPEAASETAPPSDRAPALSEEHEAQPPVGPSTRSRAGAPPPLDLEHAAHTSLDRHSLAWLLVKAAAEGVTGTLKLARGKVRKIVYIVEGRPVYVDSNLRNETLGHYMVSRGVINEDQLSKAIKQAHAGSKKLGETLVAMGLADEHTILDGLQGQVRLKIAGALRWPDGSANWAPGDDFTGRVPSCPVEPVELVLSALKRLTRAEELGGELSPELGRSFRLTPLGERFRAAAERVFGSRVLRKVLSGISLGQALGSDLDLPSLLVQVDALRLTGMAEFAPVGARPSSDEGLRPAAADGSAAGREAPAPLERKGTGPIQLRGPVIERRRRTGAIELSDLEREVPGITAERRGTGPIQLSEAVLGRMGTGEIDLAGLTTAAEPAAPRAEPPPHGARPRADSDEWLKTPSSLLELKDLDPTASRPDSDVVEIADIELVSAGHDPPPHAEEEDSGVLSVPSVEGLELDLSGALTPPRGFKLAEAAPVSPEDSAILRLKELLFQTYLGIHEKDFYQILGVDAQAAPAEIDYAWRRSLDRFSAERYQGVQLGYDTDKLAELNAIFEQAYGVLSDPLRRQTYDETLAQAKIQPEPMPDAFGAELHFQEGEARLHDRAYAAAVEAFEAAVTANPTQPDYHALLGWACFLDRGRGEAGAMAARPHLQEALRIAPDSVRAHELAGRVERDVRSFAVAVDHFVRALNAGPPRLDLYQSVKELLERLGRPDELERQCRRLIFRLREKQALATVPLWVDLAYLYNRHLGQPENARVALEVAAKLAPGDPRVLAALSTLGTDAGQDWHQVAEGHRLRVLAEPKNSAPLHDLCALHLKGNRPDHGLVPLTLLMHLGAATDQEQRLFRQLSRRPFARATRPLSEGELQDLRQGERIGPGIELVEALAPLLCQVAPLSLEMLGSSEIDLLADIAFPQPFGSIYHYVCQQLAIEPAPLYLSQSFGYQALPLPGEEAVLVVGQALVDGQSEERSAFVLARALSCIDPGRRQLLARSAADLKDALLAAVSFFNPGAMPPVASGRVAEFLSALAQSSSLHEKLSGPFRAVMNEKRINLSDWRRMVRRSSARVGLMVCADLAAAVEMVAAETDTVRDLMDFALSESYPELRRRLGVAVSG